MKKKISVLLGMALLAMPLASVVSAASTAPTTVAAEETERQEERSNSLTKEQEEALNSLVEKQGELIDPLLQENKAELICLEKCAEIEEINQKVAALGVWSSSLTRKQEEVVNSLGEKQEKLIDSLMDKRAELICLEKYDETEEIDEKLEALGVKELTPEEVARKFMGCPSIVTP